MQAVAEVSFEQVLQLAHRLPLQEQMRLAAVLPSATNGITNHSTATGQPLVSSLWGALAHLGPAPSTEEIDEARREMWGNFPREDV